MKTTQANFFNLSTITVNKKFEVKSWCDYNPNKKKETKAEKLKKNMNLNKKMEAKLDWKASTVNKIKRNKITIEDLLN